MNISESKTPPEAQNQACSCAADPFTSLPPDLKPKEKSWKTSFRQVTCPGCGLEYWTNCKDDLCSACQKETERKHHTDPAK